MQRFRIVTCLTLILAGCYGADGADDADLAEEEIGTEESALTNAQCVAQYDERMTACGRTYNNGYLYGCWVKHNQCIGVIDELCEDAQASHSWCIEANTEYCDDRLDDCQDKALDKYKACKDVALAVYIDCRTRR